MLKYCFFSNYDIWQYKNSNPHLSSAYCLIDSSLSTSFALLYLMFIAFMGNMDCFPCFINRGTNGSSESTLVGTVVPAHS